jgi:hypothetical protein
VTRLLTFVRRHWKAMCEAVEMAGFAEAGVPLPPKDGAES